jgi:hypothetical protein
MRPGLTAVHTNRTLRALRESGPISLTASKLMVLDWGALVEADDFSERTTKAGLAVGASPG